MVVLSIATPDHLNGEKRKKTLKISDVIYQTRERVFHQDIQTPRSGLKKRGAAEFFLPTSRCLDT